MPRMSVLAIAAVAALGITALATSEASARFGGGGGGLSRASGPVGGVSRAVYHPGNSLAVRRPGNIYRPGGGPKISHLPRLPYPPKLHPHRHPPHWAWHWCRHHHHHHWCHGWGIGVIDPVVVSDAPAYVTPAAAVCTNDCDYLINDGTGCYMAKRKFSTPQGDELRCVKICDEPPEVK